MGEGGTEKIYLHNKLHKYDYIFSCEATPEVLLSVSGDSQAPKNIETIKISEGTKTKKRKRENMQNSKKVMKPVKIRFLSYRQTDKKMYRLDEHLNNH